MISQKAVSGQFPRAEDPLRGRKGLWRPDLGQSGRHDNTARFSGNTAEIALTPTLRDNVTLWTGSKHPSM